MNNDLVYYGNPMNWKNVKGDLISRDALKKAFEEVYPLATDEIGGVVNKQIYEIIDNAPTVDVISNKEGYEMYNKGYMSGYEIGKKDVIRSIAKQYSTHNELVPMWLSIGDIRMGEEDD